MNLLPMFGIGMIGNNSYILEEGGRCVIIDAPYPSKDIINNLARYNLTPSAVLLTHAHFDHVLGLGEIIKEFPAIRLFISEDDRAILEDECADMCAIMGNTSVRHFSEALTSLPPISAYTFLSPEIVLPLGLTAIKTPGHTPGSVCYYQKDEGLLFSGDTLFALSVGRTDFPGGDIYALGTSCMRLMTLPEETKILPGHEGTSTIKNEKLNNSFIADLS